MRRSRLILALSLFLLSGCVATVGGDGSAAMGPDVMGHAAMGSASDTLEDLPAATSDEQVHRSQVPFDAASDARSAAAIIRAWTAPEPISGFSSLSTNKADPDLRREALSGALVGSLRRAIKLLDLLPDEFAPSSAGSADPLGDAFVGNLENVYVPPDRLVPFTGSFDLSSFEGGSVYSRAWTRDETWRGMGLGVAFPVGKRWRGAAEFGFDPNSTVNDGRVTLLFGFSRDL